MLIVPDPPSIDAVPLYSHETGQLVGIKTTFMETVSHKIPSHTLPYSFSPSHSRTLSDPYQHRLKELCFNCSFQ